jgi:hypothetical protein
MRCVNAKMIEDHSLSTGVFGPHAVRRERFREGAQCPVQVFHPSIADRQNTGHHTLHEVQFILVHSVVHVRIEPHCNVPT